MKNALKFFINGKWTEPRALQTCDVINPATEEVCATIAMGSAQDVDDAVNAARRAFPTFAKLSISERVALLERVLEVFRRREDDIAATLTEEMGCPITFSKEAQTGSGIGHIETFINILKNFKFEEKVNASVVFKEPIGVVGLITPWNWPIGQIVLKVVPALATGCTMVLKPSEISPLNAIIFAEVLEEAGVPAGVFNLVQGDGATVGEAISKHPEIDMVSFTGSTRAGILVAKAAAETIKRVTQELGGKSPNIILDDADLEIAVRGGLDGCFVNTGQTCDAPTRMFVPRKSFEKAIEIAGRYTGEVEKTVGCPDDPETKIGPLASQVQYDKVQRLIKVGIEEGATLVAGGIGRPDGLENGFYVRPTVLANVTPEMTLFREEVFGPVLCMTPYDDEADAIKLANETPYGLAAYIQSSNPERARKIAGELRAGVVYINYPDYDYAAPYGGYKQSGNGREAGAHGLNEYLEVKSVMLPR